MNFYLAARYSRRLELCDYRNELQLMGYTVTSRWLDGSHQISRDGVPINDDGEALIESPRLTPEAAALREQFALDDLEDIERADVLIAFAESPRSTASRGGRHVEFGYALAINRIIWVVGSPENLFHYLPHVSVFPTFSNVIQALVERDGVRS